MLKKFFLIFVFLFIAQAIAYSLPGDTVWVQTNVNAFQVNFSLTGDSIICLTYKDYTTIQIRATKTGELLKEFIIDNSVQEFYLSPNGKKLYLVHGYNYSYEESYSDKPLLTTINLETGDTNIKVKSKKPNVDNDSPYYLYSNCIEKLSISKDERYLTALIYYKKYIDLSPVYGSVVGLLDIQNKKFLKSYDATYVDYAVFSTTEDYFVIPIDKIYLINPENQGNFTILGNSYQHNCFLSISPNGKKLISHATDNKLLIWNIETKYYGYLYDSIALPEYYYYPRFFPNNRNIASYVYHFSGNKFYWEIYNIESKDSVFSLPTFINEFDVSPNMYYMILTLEDSNLVLIETPQAITSTKEPIKSDFSLNIFPNPFSESATISYSLPTSSQVKLSLCDIFGREVAVLADGWKEAGDNIFHLTFNIYHLSDGIYLIKLQAGGESKVIKVVKID
jgi:hypothetical protein